MKVWVMLLVMARSGYSSCMRPLQRQHLEKYSEWPRTECVWQTVRQVCGKLTQSAGKQSSRLYGDDSLLCVPIEGLHDTEPTNGRGKPGS